METNKERRYGEFVLDIAMIRRQPLPMLLRMFRDILVLRADIHPTPEDGQIHYWGVSDLFDVVPEGEMIPFYVLTHDMAADVVTAKRLGERQPAPKSSRFLDIPPDKTEGP